MTKMSETDEDDPNWVQCQSIMSGFRLTELDPAQTLTCELHAGHAGYHWRGVQPWPDPDPSPSATGAFQMLSNDRIGIRPYGGFCNQKTLVNSGLNNERLVDCMLRWQHPGPCAAPGLLWPLMSPSFRESKP